MNPEEHSKVIQGFRDLISWYEAHPDVPLPELTITNYATSDCEATARALGTFEKSYADDLFTLKKMFGPIEAKFYFMRDQVCVRRVVGTRKVEARTITYPAREEEIVEWDCQPILQPKKEHASEGTTD